LRVWVKLGLVIGLGFFADAYYETAGHNYLPLRLVTA